MLQSLRAAATQLRGLGARVVAVSRDDVEALRAFHAHEGFDFPLLSDREGRLGATYGVLAGDCCRRAAFVLDPQGVVRHADTNVRLSRYGPDLVERFQALRR